MANALKDLRRAIATLDADAAQAVLHRWVERHDSAVISGEGAV